MFTVADLLWAALRQGGAERVFCGPGGRPVPDVQRCDLPLLHVDSGRAACVLAAATAEVTGGVGVALGRLDAEAASGLGYARDNRAPLILVSDGGDDGPGPAVAKQRLTVTPGSAAGRIARAIQLALTEPRGPVVLELPPGVTTAPVPGPALNTEAPRAAPPDPAAIDAAADLIARASRPLVLAGLGCRDADAAWLRAFVEALPAPLLTTLKAKGVVPEPHPLVLGVLTGSGVEDVVVRRADLLIAVGVDPVELPAGAGSVTTPVLQLGRSAAGAGPYRPILDVVAPPGAMLEELAPILRSRPRADWDLAEVDRLKREYAQRAAALPAASRYRVARVARQLASAGAAAAIDGGPHMLPVACGWPVATRGECLVPVGLAASGVAVLLAVARGLAAPGHDTLCFAETRGLATASGALALAARLGVRIIAFGDLGADLEGRARDAGLRLRTVADDDALRRALEVARAGGDGSLIVVQE